MAKITKKFSVRHNKDMWGFDVTVSGRRIREYQYPREKDARTALDVLIGRAALERNGITQPVTSKVTVKELVSARKAHMSRAKGEPGYYTSHTRNIVLDRFLSILTPKLRVVDLSTSDLSRYISIRISEGVKPQTVYREITDIQAMLNNAFELFPDLDSWRPPRRAKLQVPKTRRDNVIPPEWLAIFYSELRKPKEPDEQIHEYDARVMMADVLQLAVQTGARNSELRTLEWTDINWHWKTAHVVSTKTERSRSASAEDIIVLPESAVELLKGIRARQNPPSKFVFPSRRGPEKPVARFWIEALRKVAAKHKIPWGYDKPNGIVLHTARHTMVTQMIAAGVDLETVRQQSRHTTKTMLMRYAHTNPAKRRSAAATLDAFAPENIVGKMTGSNSVRGVSARVH
jgi:integrase